MTAQLKPISNPDFTPLKDNWVQLAPLGEFPHPNGLNQVIDEKSVTSICNRFDQEKKEAGDSFAGLLLDFDHFSGNKDTSSEAAGWIVALDNRGADGLWGQVRWSDTGESAIKGGRYRFTSPSWRPADCEIVNRATKTVRPLRLDRAALTNDPNLKGMEPITNRAGVGELLQAEPADEPVTARACTRDMLHNAGTSEGARKGWVTRRAGGAGPRAATKADVKAAKSKGALTWHKSVSGIEGRDPKGGYAYRIDRAGGGLHRITSIADGRPFKVGTMAEVKAAAEGHYAAKQAAKSSMAATKDDLTQAKVKISLPPRPVPRVPGTPPPLPSRPTISLPARAATKDDLEKARSSAQIKATPMTRDEAHEHIVGLARELGKDRQGEFSAKLEALGPEGRKGIVQALKLKTRNLPFKAALPVMEKHGDAIAGAARQLYNHAFL